MEDAGYRTKNGAKVWKCICDCQKELPDVKKTYTYTTSSNLKRGASELNGGTASCGCLKKEAGIVNGKKNKKYNKYDLTSQKYGVGYVDNSDYYFLFDKEDYDLIKDYCWHKHQNGYLRTRIDTYKDDSGKVHNKYIMMHQLLGKHYKIGDGEEVNHKNGRPFDNRKENLRESNHSLNMKNIKLSRNNTSGHKGVSYAKLESKWKAYIHCDNKKIHLGTFENYEDAVRVREDAEKKYFGEFNREKEFLTNEEKRCG